MKIIAILLATASLSFGGWSNVMYNTDTLAVKPPSFTNLFGQSGSSSTGVVNWSLYPAKQTVDIAGFSITNINKADITEASVDNLIVVYEPSNYYPTAQTLEEHLKAIDLQIGIIQNYQATEANRPVIKIYPASWTTNSYIYDNVNANNPTNTRFWVRNDGTNILNWTAATNQTWMILNAVSGTSTGESDLVAGIFKGAQANATGVYSGSIIISCTNAVNSPQTLPITWAKHRGQMSAYSNSVMWYTFDTSARMSNDVSPRAQARHHGTVLNAAEHYDHSLTCYRTNDVITATGWNNLENDATAMTYAVWFKFNEATNAKALYIMSCVSSPRGWYGPGGYSGFAYVPDITPPGGVPGIAFSVASIWGPDHDGSGSWCGLYSTNMFSTTGVWHRAVGTYAMSPAATNGTVVPAAATMKLWLDGVYRGVITNALDYKITQNAPWICGPAYDDIPNSGFNISIDDPIIMRNTIWGTTQVTNDYQRGRTDP